MNPNTNNLTGEALSRAIAEMLVTLGQLRHETMQEGRYVQLEEECRYINPRDVWVTLLDGDELWGEVHANYATDERTAFALTVPGWQLKVEEWLEPGKPNSWIATYYNNAAARGIGVWGSTPAEAICRARLALHEREGV